MPRPPFRLARSVIATGLAAQPASMPLSPDPCCQPARPAPAPAPAARRVRLADMDSFLHCSIIGTCLSTAELRKLVPRYTSLDRQQASDVEIHHAAVQLAMEGGAGCKALQKALDERYALAVRRFGAVQDAGALLELWRGALANGDVPPAYWAIMSHPEATVDTRQSVFGDVHMLSHLVGAANRADIRRLMALEQENAAFRAKLERQQLRLRDFALQRDAAVRDLSDHVLDTAAQQTRAMPAGMDLAGALDQLRGALAAKEDALALQESRRTALESRLDETLRAAEAARTEARDASALARALQQELNAMEHAVALEAAGGTADGSGMQGRLAALRDKRVVYVGGRPSSNAAIRRMVETVGGKLLVHDGGVEVRKGMLGPLLQHADMVVFPVDCIDHDSMHVLKRVCERHQVGYYPLRTASVASFLELCSRIVPSADTDLPPGRLSRFCLRHG